MPLKLSKNTREKFQWKCTYAKERYLKTSKNVFMWAGWAQESRLREAARPLLKTMWAVKRKQYIYMPTCPHKNNKSIKYLYITVGMWTGGRCEHVQLDN